MAALTLAGYLVLHSCSLAGAAGILGNLQVESKLSPAMVGPSGIGLASWAGMRRHKLLASLGASWRDGRLQIDYLVNEMRAMGLWERVCGAKDPGQAATDFMLEYERPKTRSAVHRAQVARAVYRDLISKGAQP